MILFPSADSAVVFAVAAVSFHAILPAIRLLLCFFHARAAYSAHSSARSADRRVEYKALLPAQESDAFVHFCFTEAMQYHRHIGPETSEQ